MAGEWLIEYLEKQGKLDEEIKIAEIREQKVQRQQKVEAKDSEKHKK